MFKNYYYLLGISNNSSEDEIKEVIRSLEGKRSESLLYEIKTVLLNKELRKLYDSEYELYSASDDKQNYVITNEELKNELARVNAEIELGSEMEVNKIVEKEKKRRAIIRSLIYIVLSFIFFSIVKCTAKSCSHYMYY